MATREQVQIVEGFGSIERRSASEVAESAMQAEAMAAVQARFIVARQRPRDIAKFKANMLALCRNPKFADEALYEKPVGGDETVVDFSIRFAEAFTRLYGNLDVSTEATFDDPARRKIRVTATDLEGNATFRSDRMLEKTVERRYAGEDRTVISSRLNSRRQKVFIVVATEEEFFTKEAAAASKLIRTNVLRFVDEDFKDECRKEIDKALKQAAANDPQARTKRLVEAFARFGVSPEKVKAYLGHALDAMSPDELIELQRAWVAVREGESFNEICEAKVARRNQPSATGATSTIFSTTPSSDSKSDALAAKLGGRAEEQRAAGLRSTPKPGDAAPQTGPASTNATVVEATTQELATASQIDGKPHQQRDSRIETEKFQSETVSTSTNPIQPQGSELFPSSPRDEHKDPAKRSKRS
jgi:hypothetical protein